MAFNFNGNTPKSIIYNGYNVAKLVYNNVVVWVQKFLATVRGTNSITLTKATEEPIQEVKLYGKCQQGKLPEEYTELEYLESTGTQYIDTGIEINNNKLQNGIKTELSASFNTKTSSQAMLKNSDPYYFVGVNNSGYFYSGLGNAYLTTNLLNDNKKHLFELDSLDKTFKIDGITKTTYNTTYNGAAFSNIFLFQVSNGNYPSNAKIYYCKIYDNNTLVRNLIPAKNSSGTIGMYDLVTNTFFTNQGTGEFITGPEIVPTPDAPMDIWCNNGVLKVRNKSGLPLEYQAVEYLQSDGACYIDLNRVPNNSDIIEQKFQMLGVPSGVTSWYGSMPSSSVTTPRICLGSNSYANIFCSVNTTFTVVSPADTDAHIIKFWAPGSTTIKAIIDGEEKTGTVSKSAYNPAVTLSSYLFARHGDDGVQVYDGSGTKIYYHKEYLQDGTIQLDLIPCRRRTDNVLGMYDLVNGNFLTNQGTGTFTAGADIDDLDIYTDGTQETIEITGKNLLNSADFITGFGIKTDGAEILIRDSVCTPYIKVKPNTKYTLSGVASLSGFYNYRGCEYNNSYTKTQNISGNTEYTTLTFTTSATTEYIRITLKCKADQDISQAMLELGSTATTYEAYYNGGTAIAENLLSVGDYEDIQEIISGSVTRNIGILVLDGTETWNKSEAGNFYNSVSNIRSDVSDIDTIKCSHFKQGERNTTLKGEVAFRVNLNGFKFNWDANATLTQWKQFLATQYANGTPVIIVYPLETPTTETVTAQPLNAQEGTNIIDITQASLNDLELEATYYRTM